MSEINGSKLEFIFKKIFHFKVKAKSMSEKKLSTTNLKKCSAYLHLSKQKDLLILTNPYRFVQN